VHCSQATSASPNFYILISDMRHIFLFFLSASLVIGAVFGVWWHSLGFYQTAEHWLVEAIMIKDARAKAIKGRKVIIIAGSNALFGVDSENLERLIGIPVVNFATHAGLSLDFHISIALKYAARGDIVLMPMEFDYYSYQPGLTTWQVTNMSTWGHEFIKSDLLRAVEYFRYSNFTDVLERLNEKPIPHETDEMVLSTAKWNSEIGLPPWVGYSYRSMNAWGDIVAGEGAKQQDEYVYVASPPTAFAMKSFKRLRDALLARGAQLKLTWPVSMRSPAFDLGTLRDRKLVEGIKNAYASEGLSIDCDAGSFQLDPRLFLDTRYHVGAEGTQLRTAALAACLLGEPYDQTVGEKLYAERLVKLRVYPDIFQKHPAGFLAYRNDTISDLEKIRDALFAYKAQKGKYPVRPSWDGFYSIYGPSGANWIPDIVPEFIPELPRDRRLLASEAQQYLYKSDGVDFKLISNSIQNCEVYERDRGDLIDPARHCIAVGFWSEGARDW
jgi:hypothetical protein